MFQFTREFIINDNEGKLTGGVKFLTDTDAKTMFVDNMVNIRKQDVNTIYKHPHEAEVKEKVTIKAAAISGVTAGEVVRLVITLGQRGKTTATYNDYYPDHSRHFFYETVVETGKTTGTDVIDGLLKSVAHEATLRGEKFVDIKKDTNGLVIEALDCYTVIKEVRIVKLPQPTPTAKIGALLTGYEDWAEIISWKRADGTTAKVTLREGKEGNGNTVQILKNMRLLTDANLNPYGLDMDERPLPKGKYDQYTVELVTERRHIGHDVMGSVGTSLTTLVFYVLTGATSTAFATALETLWGTPLVAVEAPAEPERILAHTADLPDAAESGSGTASSSEGTASQG